MWHDRWQQVLEVRPDFVEVRNDQSGLERLTVPLTVALD